MPLDVQTRSGPDVGRPVENRSTGPPGVVRVSAGGDIWQREVSVAVGHGKMRRVHDDDVSGRARVDVAEDPAQTGTIEWDVLDRADRVEAQFEPLAVAERENIVENAIVVRERDGGAH